MKTRLILKQHQWKRIAGLLPGKITDCGQTAKDNRMFVEAVLYIARTGSPWRDLPPIFGGWNSAYKRFSRWCEAGVWEKIFEELSRGADFEDVSIDSTAVRAHQHSSGAQKKRAIKLLAVLAAA